MSKINLKNAVCLILVRCDDWHLLGVCWHGRIYNRQVFAFQSQVNRPTSSTAIHWIFRHSYIIQHLLHYLDEFFTAGPTDSPVCVHNLAAMYMLCDRISAPIKTSEVEGPTTSLTLLGMPSLWRPVSHTRTSS